MKSLSFQLNGQWYSITKSITGKYTFKCDKQLIDRTTFSSAYTAHKAV